MLVLGHKRNIRYFNIQFDPVLNLKQYYFNNVAFLKFKKKKNRKVYYEALLDRWFRNGKIFYNYKAYDYKSYNYSLKSYELSLKEFRVRDYKKKNRTSRTKLKLNKYSKYLFNLSYKQNNKENYLSNFELERLTIPIPRYWLKDNLKPYTLKKVNKISNLIYLNSFKNTKDFNNNNVKKNILNDYYYTFLKRYHTIKKYNSFYYFKKISTFRRLKKKLGGIPYKKFLFLKRHIKRYNSFYYLEKLKKYNDCFYIISNFLNLYNSNYKKHNYKSNKNKYSTSALYFLIKRHTKEMKQYSEKELLSYSQKFKYNNYLKWFNDNFKYNYKNVQLILNSYYNIYSKKKNSILNWNEYLHRQRKLFKYNFFYRLYKKKKNIFYYNYFYNKKFTLLQKYKINKNKNHHFSNYVNDISLLFYDKIINLNYTDHIDEKYFFYIKNLLFNKINNNLKSKFNNSFLINFKNKKLFNTKFIFKNKYSIKYNKLYFFLFFKNYKINNSNHNYFYSFNIIKYFIFILKNKIFNFFKEYIIHKYKIWIYHFRFKKNIIKKQDNWYELFFHKNPFNKNEFIGKNEYIMKKTLYFLLFSESFFSINYSDWFFFY